MAKPERIRSDTANTTGAAICIFGVPGVGKTRFIGTGANTLIIRPAEDHVNSIVDQSNFDDLVVSSWGELLGDEGAWRWIQQGGYEEYDWFWLDSLSLWQGAGLKDLFDAAVDRSPHRAEYGLDKQEYGINQFRIETFVRNMVGLADEGKLNFGIVCHTMEWWDPHNEVMLWAPNIQGREGLFMQKVCGMMHTVAYYYLHQPEDGGKPSRVLRTRADGRNIFVKDQLDLAPKGRLVNPTMDDINNAIKPERPTRRKKTTRRTRR